MVLAILIVLGLSIVCPIIGAIIGIIGGIKNRNTNHASNYHANFHDNHRTSFSHEQRDSRSYRILSIIIGKAASTGKMKTMKDMMIGMTAFGMKESFETSFSFSEFQFKI